MAITEPPGRGRRVPARATALATAAGAALVLLLAGAHHDSASAVQEASAAPERAPVGTQLQRMLTRLVNSHPSFPGAVAAVRTPRLAWVGAAGVADRATRRRLTPDATFRIASVTKTFTAAAILRLVETGKLALDDPIARHLSRGSIRLLRDGGYDVDNIQVGYLLRHTSGLAGDYSELQAYLEFILTHPRHRWTRAEQIRFVMSNSKPLAAPGSEYHYSDTGYVLLGEVLARVTGRRLAAAYRSVLHFGRLGLDETYLETREPKPAAAKRRAHQYLGRLDTTGFDPSFDLHGAGGLVSTVDDLARFYRALMAGRIFKRAGTLRTMLSNGMGIEEAEIGGERCFGHGGFWGDAAYHCPRSAVTIASMINQAEGFIRPTGELLQAVHRLVAPKTGAAGASPPPVAALAPPRGHNPERAQGESAS